MAVVESCPFIGVSGRIMSKGQRKAGKVQLPALRPQLGDLNPTAREHFYFSGSWFLTKQPAAANGRFEYYIMENLVNSRVFLQVAHPNKGHSCSVRKNQVTSRKTCFIFSENRFIQRITNCI